MLHNIYTENEILAKAWLVKEVVNLLLSDEHLSVDKIFLIGSYASGKQDEWSDLDFLVQLQGGKKIGQVCPSWNMIQKINMKINNKRIHIVFGTEEVAKSLHEKHKNDKKDYSYKPIPLGGIQNANTHCTSN